MSLAWAAGEVLTAAKMNARQPLYVDKSAGAQSVTSSTVVVDDTALQLTLLPNRVYEVRCVLSVTGGAGDLKTAWSLGGDLVMSAKRAAYGPGTATTDVTAEAAAATTVGVNRSSSAHANTAGVLFGLDGTNATAAVEEFEITTGATGGLLKLMWAQRASNAVSTVVGVDSWLRATPVG